MKMDGRSNTTVGRSLLTALPTILVVALEPLGIGVRNLYPGGYAAGFGSVMASVRWTRFRTDWAEFLSGGFSSSRPSQRPGKP